MISPGPIPTVDFYLRSRASRSSCRMRYVFDIPTPDEELQAGTFVVIVRHAAPTCLDWLLRNTEALSGVAYLMDDDIPAAWRCGDVPFDYGLWTSARYWSIARRLALLCDRLWVSTPVLARRYAARQPTLVAPSVDARDIAPAQPGCRRWGYHGTRIHHGELRWLVPLVRQVHEQFPEVTFEVFGGSVIGRLFSSLPRVKVLMPRSWPEYQEHCRANPLAIGVAPLLPGRFNTARSHVKLFDMARCGALGVFSGDAPYADILREAGCRLAAADHRSWFVVICELFGNESRRLADYEKTSGWIREACKDDRLESLIERASVTQLVN